MKKVLRALPLFFLGQNLVCADFSDTASTCTSFGGIVSCEEASLAGSVGSAREVKKVGEFVEKARAYRETDPYQASDLYLQAIVQHRVYYESVLTELDSICGDTAWGRRCTGIAHGVRGLPKDNFAVEEFCKE